MKSVHYIDTEKHVDVTVSLTVYGSEIDLTVHLDGQPDKRIVACVTEMAGKDHSDRFFTDVQSAERYFQRFVINKVSKQPNIM